MLLGWVGRGVLPFSRPLDYSISRYLSGSGNIHIGRKVDNRQGKTHENRHISDAIARRKPRPSRGKGAKNSHYQQQNNNSQHCRTRPRQQSEEDNARHSPNNHGDRDSTRGDVMRRRRGDKRAFFHRSESITGLHAGLLSPVPHLGGAYSRETVLTHRHLSLLKNDNVERFHFRYDQNRKLNGGKGRYYGGAVAITVAPHRAHTGALRTHVLRMTPYAKEPP